MGSRRDNPVISNIILIFLCFLLTSTGWLSWEYHLLDQMDPGTTDIVTMVIGYLLQAAGIAAAALIRRRMPASSGVLMPAALILHIICMVPAALSTQLAGTVAFGLLMNVSCGMIAGCYLYSLAGRVPKDQTATVFGIGYASAILGSFLLSRIGDGSVYYSGRVLMISGVLTVLAIIAARQTEITEEPPQQTDPSCSSRRTEDRGMLRLIFVMIVLFGMVNNCGFAFPTADIGSTVNVEFSRLVYAAGLIIAGLVTDRDRKHGAVLALAALVIPFILLSLRGEEISSLIFWLLSYFTFGFYSVYRIILFSDIAGDMKLYLLSGFGLMAGRIGDAAGEAVCIALNDHLAALVIAAAVFFTTSVAVFFKVYPQLYIPKAVHEMSEREKFYRFSTQHDLSTRERDMLRLILEEKTVAEIAEALSISENTVKYHVKNILQKTGNRTRKDLVAAYLGHDPD